MDLKTYTETAKVRQKDLAARVGCRQPTISQILTGTRRPSPDLALRIQRATGGKVTVMELLYGERAKDAA
jgi:DNA-binding transcriptional regulator YdaS (Cro superfamily)